MDAPVTDPTLLAAVAAVERARRFWTAHGRSTDDLTVLHALCCNPTTTWNPDLLSMWYGIRIDRAYRILEEFATCGIVRAVDEVRDGYRWNSVHDWAAPRSSAIRRLVQERWMAETGCGSTLPTLPAPSPSGLGADRSKE